MSLISQFCNGRQLRRTIAASRGRLYRVALAWCGDEMLADDLVQETLERSLQNVHQLRDTSRLYPWLYSILNNCWRQHWRRYRPHEDLDEDRASETPGPESLVGEMELVARVRAAVALLPSEQRKVVALVDLEGLSYCEVAEVLEIPMGTVMSRLYRARQSLALALENCETAAPGKAAALKRVK